MLRDQERELNEARDAIGMLQKTHDESSVTIQSLSEKLAVSQRNLEATTAKANELCVCTLQCLPFSLG